MSVLRMRHATAAAAVQRLLLRMEGTNGGTSFTDSSPRARAVANASGLVTTSTAQILSGTLSGRFPGSSGAYLTLTSDASSLLPGDFTVHALAYFDTNGSVPEDIYSIAAGAGVNLALYRNSAGRLELFLNAAFRIEGAPVSGGEKHHVCVERVSGVCTLYLDGHPFPLTYSSSATVGHDSGTSEFVGAFTSGAELLSGYLDDVEVTSGARFNGDVSAYKFNGWSWINKASNSDTTSGTSLALPAASLTAGNHIFVFVRYETTTATVSVSDTAGNTYTALTEQVTSQGAIGRWFYCLNAAGHASNVVTITWSAARTYRYAYSLQYHKPSAAFDAQTGKVVAAAGSITSDAMTTAGAGLVLVGEVSYNNDGGNQSAPLPLFRQHVNSYSAVWTYSTRAALSSWTVTVTGGTSTTRGLCLASFV